MTKSIYGAVGFVQVRTPLLPFEFLDNGDKREANHSELARAAIAVASRSLSQSLNKGPQYKSSVDKAKLYERRMCTRPTPYGLFAGVALAEFGTSTDLRRSNKIRTVTRPDMCWLAELVDTLEKDKELRRDLRFFANPEASLKSNRIWLARQLVWSEGTTRAVNIKATCSGVTS